MNKARGAVGGQPGGRTEITSMCQLIGGPTGCLGAKEEEKNRYFDGNSFSFLKKHPFYIFYVANTNVH